MKGNGNGDDQNQKSPDDARPADAATTPQHQPKEKPYAQTSGAAKPEGGQERRILGFPALDLLQTSFDGLLLLTALAGAWYVNKQIELTKQQMADAQGAAIGQQRATNRALSIAEDQAKALSKLVPATTSAADAASTNATNSERIAKSSERGIEATRDALRLEQRAWVGVTEVTDVTFEDGKRAGMSLWLTNTGKTPALGARFHGAQQQVPVGVPVPDLPLMRVDMPWSDQVVLPGQRIRFPLFTTLPINDDIVRRVRLHEVTVYVRLRTSYRDIFGQQHETTYCGFLEDDLKTMSFCSFGNAAD